MTTDVQRLVGRLTVGDTATLAREIVVPATGDHPAFLMGKKGEVVTVVKLHDVGVYPYIVEGPTNPGKPWAACDVDFLPPNAGVEGRGERRE